MRHSRHLIDEAQRKRLLRHGTRKINLVSLKAVSQALNQVINCLPGQRDVDTAIKEIAAASVALTTGQYPPAGDMSFQDVQTSLSVSAAVANSRGTHMQLAQASKKFAGKCNVHSRLMLAGLSKVRGRETDRVRGNDGGF